jgi:hypothetical protein
MRALLLALLVACGSKSAPTGNASKLPPSAADLDACTLADECTLVDACCGCSAGGKKVALRKDKVAEYDATRASRCGDSMCPQVISTHSSCHAEAVCENDHCKVMAHMRPDDGTAPAN